MTSGTSFFIALHTAASDTAHNPSTSHTDSAADVQPLPYC